LIEKKFERHEEIYENQERINATRKEAYSNDIQNKLNELLEEKLELKEKRIQQLEKEVMASHLDLSDPQPIVFKSEEEPTLLLNHENKIPALKSSLPHQMIKLASSGYPKMGIAALKSSHQNHSTSKEESTLYDLPSLKSSAPDQITEKNKLADHSASSERGPSFVPLQNEHHIKTIEPRKDKSPHLAKGNSMTKPIICGRRQWTIKQNRRLVPPNK